MALDPILTLGLGEGKPLSGLDEHRRLGGPGVARAAQPERGRQYVQIDAGCYNAFIQEQSLGIHYNQANDLLDYVSNPEVFAYEDGMVKIPTGPGLGIEPEMDRILQAHELYKKVGSGARDDAVAMRYLVPGWQYDPKQPSLGRARR